MLRRLRIAASVFFAVVAVTLCVLWVRSYWRHDVLGIFIRGRTIAIFGSADGTLCVDICKEFHREAHDPLWFARSMPVREAWPYHGKTPTIAPAGFLIKIYPSDTFLVSPHWFAALIVAIPFGTLTRQFPMRFSLRTMLIATTLFAVALGLVCYTFR